MPKNLLIHSEEIQQALDIAAQKYGAVGIQAAVVRKGQPAETYVFGWATKDADRMTPLHKFRTASLTKIAIGIALMLLQEQGLIQLDDPVSGHWGNEVRNPNHPETPITVRNCLTHTSSIVSFDPEVSRTYNDMASRLLRAESYTEAVPGDPGAWEYNNYVYSLLGMTLERAAGDFLDSVLNTGMWDKLGVDAAMESGEILDTAHLVTLYRHDGSVGRSVATQKASRRPISPALTGIYFAGGMTASAGDLAQMTAMLVNDGEFDTRQILTPKSVEIMEQLQFMIAPDVWQAQPMDYQENLFGRKKIYYHTGSAYGAYNLLSYDPDSGDGAVVLTSGALGSKDDRGIYAVCSDITKTIYTVLSTPRPNQI